VSERTTLSSRAVIRLVAGREISQRLRAKSFYIATGLLVLVIIAVGVISRLAGGDDAPSAIKVAVVGEQSDDVVDAIEQSANIVDRGATVDFFASADLARAAMQDGAFDVAIIPADHRAIFKGDVNQEVLAVTQQAWALIDVRQSLADAGLSPDDITGALAVTPLQAVALDGDEETSNSAALTGTLAAILLFLSLQTFGSYVLTGVVEEKSSAVVEVLLVRARADQMLAGKVIGIGLAGLSQFAVTVVAALVSLKISGTDAPSDIWSAIPMTLVWFIGGFALYSTLFALAGSLVSRQEDAQAAAAPITYSLVGAYMLVFVLGYAPRSTLSTVVSMLPPIAPMLMPMRMAAGAASVAEVAIAVVLLILSTWGAWKLAARIYEQVLLRRGSRISWRDALKLLRR